MGTIIVIEVLSTEVSCLLIKCPCSRLRSVQCSLRVTRRRLFAPRSPSPAADLSGPSPGVPASVSSGRMAPIPLDGPSRAHQLFGPPTPDLFSPSEAGSLLSPQLSGSGLGTPLPMESPSSLGSPAGDPAYGPGPSGKFFKWFLSRIDVN